jgi:hypothetical protein
VRITVASLISRRITLLVFVIATAIALSALAGLSIPGFGFSDGPL